MRNIYEKFLEHFSGCLGTIIFFVVSIAILSLLTDPNVKDVSIESFKVFLFAALIPIACAIGWIFGRRFSRSETRYTRIFGILLMIGFAIAGFASFVKVAPDIDPAECPAGPRYC